VPLFSRKIWLSYGVRGISAIGYSSTKISALHRVCTKEVDKKGLALPYYIPGRALKYQVPAGTMHGNTPYYQVQYSAFLYGGPTGRHIYADTGSIALGPTTALLPRLTCVDLPYYQVGPYSTTHGTMTLLAVNVLGTRYSTRLSYI